MEPKRLFDFMYHQQEHMPQQQAFGGRRDGAFFYYSTDEVLEKARQLSHGLLGLGLQPGDKVAMVVYQNRPEWVVTDLALQQLGLINVPVYPTISPQEYSYIFRDAGVKFCFAGSGDLYEKVSSILDEVESFKGIYTFDQQEGAPHWETLMTEGDDERIKARMEAIKPHDLATLIYTSGTTGQPKGVMLSHNNIVSNVLSVKELFPISTGETALSFLPLCHIFERTALYVYTYFGIQVVFTGTDNLGGEEGDLRAVRPHFFTTVPRLLEKVYEKIVAKGQELSGVKKSLFFWALSLTRDYEYDQQPGPFRAIKLSIADKLIFSKWREALGGRVKGIVSGAAACPRAIAQVFSAAGIPIREGYGLTETSPGLAIGRFTPGGAMLGTIGPAIDGVELRIDTSDGQYGPGEGEILAHGPNVMMGYYNKPEATGEVIFEEHGKRWFRTGDIGTLVDGPEGQSFLKITDRKKELLKTSGGKYVAPAPIEGKLREHFLVEQVMVVGEKRKFVSAIIVPSEENLMEWCHQHDLPHQNIAEAIADPAVRQRFEKIVNQANPSFSHIEQIKKFELVAGPWGPVTEDGSPSELTPTLKLKRRVIREKYAHVIERIYAS